MQYYQLESPLDIDPRNLLLLYLNFVAFDQFLLISPAPSPWWQLFYSLSLCFRFHINDMQILSFSVWFISPSVMPSIFIHIVANDTIYFSGLNIPHTYTQTHTYISVGVYKYIWDKNISHIKMLHIHFIYINIKNVIYILIYKIIYLKYIYT